MKAALPQRHRPLWFAIDHYVPQTPITWTVFICDDAKLSGGDFDSTTPLLLDLQYHLRPLLHFASR